MPRWEVVLHEACSIISQYFQENSPQWKHIFHVPRGPIKPIKQSYILALLEGCQWTLLAVYSVFRFISATQSALKGLHRTIRLKAWHWFNACLPGELTIQTYSHPEEEPLAVICGYSLALGHASLLAGKAQERTPDPQVTLPPVLQHSRLLL